MSAAMAGDGHGVEDDVEVGRSCIAVAPPPPARLVADEESSAEDEEEKEGAVGTTSSTAALAVAATAAVELTNLFFFLHGGGAGRAVAPRRRGQRRCGEMGLLPVELVESVTVILALAAFMSAAGLLLLRQAADLGHYRIVSPACSTAVLVASTAALFVASLGTVSLLLHDYQHAVIRDRFSEI
uniref:Uncharacterized protein n=1 Tax=Oryza punctata TaxID=4537 RepID=A0A0E0JVY7_ORYPU